jgi:hypothetical protein
MMPHSLASKWTEERPSGHDPRARRNSGGTYDPSKSVALLRARTGDALSDGERPVGIVASGADSVVPQVSRRSRKSSFSSCGLSAGASASGEDASSAEERGEGANAGLAGERGESKLILPGRSDGFKNPPLPLSGEAGDPTRSGLGDGKTRRSVGE